MRFWHGALFYRGLEQFMERTLPFIRDGIAGGEPILAVIDATKIEALRGELGTDARKVGFADAGEVGLNPARIIPAWQRFIDISLRPDRPVRGIGEPIWAGRDQAELVECQAHETLLNVAFGDSPQWSLLCPYDEQALDADVIDEARRSHPFLVSNGRSESSHQYVDEHPSPARWDHPLTPAPVDAHEFAFGAEAGSLRQVRWTVSRFAAATGMAAIVVDRLTLAVSEVATNSIRYGGGQGTVRLWTPRHRAVVCEISDTGHITGSALLGRMQPSVRQRGGRGLWLANQICDLVQIRTSQLTGTTVRVHVSSSET